MKYLRLMRVKHYIKNILIFLPLFFANSLFDRNVITNAIIGFIAFSFSSSFIYIINDINDIEKDKLHPVKKNRPLASGSIKKSHAILLAVLLITLSFSILFFNKEISLVSIAILAIYVLMNIFYSLGLKNIPIVDICILMMGFLLRVLFGGYLFDIPVSSWLYLTIMSFSFYMGLGKRRNEINHSNKKVRKVLEFYTPEFLDKFMHIFLGLAIVFYSLWCMDIQSTQNITVLMWTIPLIVIILMKYSLNIEMSDSGDPVEVLFKDKILIFLVMIYGTMLFIIFYY